MAFGFRELMSMNVGSDSLMAAFHLITLWVMSVVDRMGEFMFMNLVFSAKSCSYLGEELLCKGNT